MTNILLGIIAVLLLMILIILRKLQFQIRDNLQSVLDNIMAVITAKQK